MVFMKRFLLFVLLIISLGTSCSFAQSGAFGHYHKAEALKEKVKKNDVEAMNQLGLLYLSELFDKEESAVELFEKASARGHQDATYNLGYCYFTAKGVEQNYQKAFSLFLRVAETVKEAPVRIGVCYLFGYGIKKNNQEAIKWFEKGLTNGDNAANFYLAYVYGKGEGVVKDERKALQLYLPFAQKGNSFAQYQMAQIYYNGETVPKDCNKALTWFEKVADKYYDAWVIMGEIYEKGDGISKNLTKAKECYQQASDYGIPLGEYRLGAILYDEKKYDEAFSLLTQAAEDKKNPVPEAMRKLAACYRYGLGTPQNLEKEQYWMNEAAKNKDYKAIDILNEKITIDL